MNRRDLLKGIAVAGATAATPIIGASIASGATKPSRAAWDKAMADHLRAIAVSDAYDPEYERIAEAHKAALDRVPHVAMPDSGSGRVLTTAKWDDVAMARSDCRSIRYVETCAYEDVKARQQFVDGADQRDAVIAEINRRFDWHAVNERYDAMQVTIGDTETVLLNMPAPDAEALLWKVERLYEPGDGIWSEGVEDQTFADLHRFLSAGRA